jgi:hypothetical protein
MPWRCMGKWRCTLTFMDLGTRWRWVVSFTPRTHHFRRKNRPYPLYRRLDGYQNRSGNGAKQTNFLPCRKSSSGRPGRSPSLYQLSYPNPADNFYAYIKARNAKLNESTIEMKVNGASLSLKTHYGSENVEKSDNIYSSLFGFDKTICWEELNLFLKE